MQNVLEESKFEKNLLLKFHAQLKLVHLSCYIVFKMRFQTTRHSAVQWTFE